MRAITIAVIFLIVLLAVLFVYAYFATSMMVLGFESLFKPSTYGLFINGGWLK